MKRLLVLPLVIGLLVATAISGEAAYRVDHHSPSHPASCSNVPSNQFINELSEGLPETIDLHHIDDYLPELFPPGTAPIAFFLRASTPANTSEPATTVVSYRFGAVNSSTPWRTITLHFDQLGRIWVPGSKTETLSIFSPSSAVIQLYPCYRPGRGRSH